MQIALHDIRRIGYFKILAYFEEQDIDIFDEIKKLNTKIYSYDNSSFSILNTWTNYEDFISEDYHGFCSLVNNYTPMVSELGADNISKRKFRNTWVKMWNFVAKDMDISNADIDIIADCGIRLVYYISELHNNGENVKDELLNVLNFYNSVFKWTIFSDKELNFKKNEMSHINVIELLSLTTTAQFEEIILTEIC